MTTAETELFVVGAGGHGRELHAYIEDLERAGCRVNLRGYLDDGLPPGQHGRLHILGPLGQVPLHGYYITAVGSNSIRREMVERISAMYVEDGLLPWTLIHPSAYLGENVEIGAGGCIAPGAVLTANVKIGRHSIVNVRASVSHDCVLGDYVNINPGAAICGSVSIGEGAYIGAGAVVKDKVKVGAWSIIGAGAVVIRDIPPNVTAVGVPARVVK